MIIISDTSVITNLLQIGKVELLKALFNEITIPPTVKEELEKIPIQREFLSK